MKRATRKGIPGRPIGFTRRMSAAVYAVERPGHPCRTWEDLVTGFSYGNRRVRDYLAGLVHQEGYRLSDPIPADLVRKGDRLRRRSARYQERKAGAR